jgi:predicted MFS family arabinose efflux permease
MASVGLLQNRDFVLLWGGQVVSTLGSMASHVIYPLLILALTDSPAAAGIAGALRFLPYLVFSLPVGALIDRWDRKRVMVLSDLGRAAAVASIPIAIAFDALTVGHVYAVCFVEGTLFVFFNIAEVAALPRVVPRAQLPEATAYNEAGFGVAHIVGPSLGTVLYQAFGRAVPFLVDAITYLLSLAALLAIKATFQADVVSARADLRAEIAQGLRWLWSKPLIRFMAFVTGGINVLNAAMPLVMIVLAKELGANDAQIGLVFSIAGVGGVLGSLVGGRMQRRFTFGQVISATMWIAAVSFLLFVASPGYVWLGIFAAIYFFVGPIYNVVQFSYRVALIPDELQGRVNSVFRLVAFGFMPLGAALAGVAIEALGVRMTIVLFAAAFFALAALTTFNRSVRNAPSIEQAISVASSTR